MIYKRVKTNRKDSKGYLLLLTILWKEFHWEHPSTQGATLCFIGILDWSRCRSWMLWDGAHTRPASYMETLWCSRDRKDRESDTGPYPGSPWRDGREWGVTQWWRLPEPERPGCSPEGPKWVTQSGKKSRFCLESGTLGDPKDPRTGRIRWEDMEGTGICESDDRDDGKVGGIK